MNRQETAEILFELHTLAKKVALIVPFETTVKLSVEPWEEVAIKAFTNRIKQICQIIEGK